jgi:hypothetical protein
MHITLSSRLMFFVLSQAYTEHNNKYNSTRLDVENKGMNRDESGIARAVLHTASVHNAVLQAASVHNAVHMQPAFL